VGGTLLRALLETARSQGFGALSLSVERGNPAAELYERNGFVKLFSTDSDWVMKVYLSASGRT
jgi:ribosomal protein S18 acetylase RimI-like enzyme